MSGLYWREQKRYCLFPGGENMRREDKTSSDREFLDILIDFIIVSANLAKKINKEMKHMKGVKNYG